MRGAAVLFSRASDLWATPKWLFDELHREFGFDADAAADATNHLCPVWFGAGSPFDQDALTIDWAPRVCFCNPPYSIAGRFVEKAAIEAARGATTVLLLPSRTDVRWFHEHVWDAAAHQPRPGVELRLLRGRLRFGDAVSSAPFPSCIVVMRPGVGPDQALQNDLDSRERRQPTGVRAR